MTQDSKYCLLYFGAYCNSVLLHNLQCCHEHQLEELPLGDCCDAITLEA